MNKKVTVLMISLIACGCTSKKPEMPYDNYQRIALLDVAADRCVSLGFMDVQIAAAAKNYLGQDLNSWSYDLMLYQNAYAEKVKMVNATPPQKEDCDTYAIGVAQRLQREQSAYQRKQLAAQQQQAFSQSMQAIQNSKPKTTYCNNIGGQTVCNTY